MTAEPPDPRRLGRLLSAVERGEPAEPGPSPGESAEPGGADRGDGWVVGITGPGGVGKSTLVDQLIDRWRKAGRTVAVLAVDPSSPLTGGALLGDRVRMGRHALDRGVFIRSLATRGQLGGLAAAVPAAVQVLIGARFDVVIIETAGVGQSEVDVARLADSTVVVLAPGLGDGVQAAKAGLLEVADILVVNKADRDGADAAIRDLREMTRLAPADHWRPPVIAITATSGHGVEELLAALDQHGEHRRRAGAAG